MADHAPPPPMSQVETDSLVITVSNEVLKTVEVSFNKKIDPVLKRLEACSSKLAAFDIGLTKAEQRISESEDAPMCTCNLCSMTVVYSYGFELNKALFCISCLYHMSFVSFWKLWMPFTFLIMVCQDCYFFHYKMASDKSLLRSAAGM